MTIRRIVHDDDSTTTVDVGRMAHHLEDVRERMALLDERAASTIASLPPVPMRATFARRHVKQKQEAADAWPGIVARGDLNAAQEHGEQAQALLEEAQRLRVEIVENPLCDAIRKMHGCASSYVESTHHTERTDAGSVLWTGIVHSFNLRGHPTATRAYAWSHRTDEGKERFVAVLAGPAITTPQKAVQAAIIAEDRDR